MESVASASGARGKVISVSQFKYTFQDVDNVPLDTRLRVYHASPHEPLSSISDPKEATMGGSRLAKDSQARDAAFFGTQHLRVLQR